MISSTTSSSSAAAGETSRGLYGRTVGPTMHCDAFGGAVSSSGAIGFTDRDSGASLTTLVLAPDGLVVTSIASGIVTNLSPADADLSPSPSPPAVVVDFSAGCQAPEDPDMGANGVTSALGSA